MLLLWIKEIKLIEVQLWKHGKVLRTGLSCDDSSATLRANTEQALAIFKRHQNLECSETISPMDKNRHFPHRQLSCNIFAKIIGYMGSESGAD